LFGKIIIHERQEYNIFLEKLCGARKCGSLENETEVSKALLKLKNATKDNIKQPEMSALFGGTEGCFSVY